MFNFEQLYVDSSFSFIKAKTSLDKVMALLNTFVILEGAITYVVDNGELKHMHSFDLLHEHIC